MVTTSGAGFLCKSKRHWHFTKEQAGACCKFSNPEPKDELNKRREELQGDLKRHEKEASQIKAAIAGIEGTRSTLETKVNEIKKARSQKLIKGEIPDSSSDLPSLMSDIEELQGLATKKSDELYVASTRIGKCTHEIKEIESEITRSDCHERLAQYHAKMVALVNEWNECVNGIIDLAKEAGQKDLHVNYGEFPVLPVEMSVTTVTGADNPQLVAKGLKVNQHFHG